MTVISTSPRKSILGRFPYVSHVRVLVVVLASIGAIHLVNSVLPFTGHAVDSSTLDSSQLPGASQLLLESSSLHVPVVRVYMYDMPPEFNVGLLSVYWSTSHGKAKGGAGERASRKRGRKRRSGDGNRRRLLQALGDSSNGSSTVTDATGASLDPGNSGSQNNLNEWEHHMAMLDYPRHQHAAEWFLFDFLRKLQPLTSPPSDSTPEASLQDADVMLASATGGPGGKLALSSSSSSADVAAGRLSREAVTASSVRVLRVANHSDADLVYVPIFSSLLLKVAQVTGRRNITEADLERRAVEWVKAQPAWQATRGRNHVWPATHPRALTSAALPMLSDASEGALAPVLLVSDFGRVEGGGRGGNANVVKDVVMPYVHRVEPWWEEEHGHERPTLLYFRGNIHRKAVSGGEGEGS